jgi:thiosulfate/3-mercaptopyruvate sulfurtransferase
MKIVDTLISLDDFIDLQRKQSVVLLDCTFYLMEPAQGRREYLQAHIPGAFYLDTNHDLSAPVVPHVTGRHPLPNPEVLANTLRQCGLNHGMQVIAYDQSNGVYASRAWWLLNWLGHKEVAVLDGGFKNYIAHQHPVDNQWPPPLKGNFVPNVQSQMAVTMEDILRDRSSLVDSREYSRYAGEHEPIDAIAGHIPGAICIPYQDNVTADGFWQKPAYLEKKFSDLSNTIDTPVFYCGSGVTACHNILAYKLATGKEAKLYGGSYSEWINYHPVETTIR